MLARPAVAVVVVPILAAVGICICICTCGGIGIGIIHVGIGDTGIGWREGAGGIRAVPCRGRDAPPPTGSPRTGGRAAEGRRADDQEDPRDHRRHAAGSKDGEDQDAPRPLPLPPVVVHENFQRHLLPHHPLLLGLSPGLGGLLGLPLLPERQPGGGRVHRGEGGGASGQPAHAFSLLRAQESSPVLSPCTLDALSQALGGRTGPGAWDGMGWDGISGAIVV